MFSLFFFFVKEATTIIITKKKVADRTKTLRTVDTEQVAQLRSTTTANVITAKQNTLVTNMLRMISPRLRLQITIVGVVMAITRIVVPIITTIVIRITIRATTISAIETKTPIMDQSTVAAPRRRSEPVTTMERSLTNLKPIVTQKRPTLNSISPIVLSAKN